jgi:hypothetical protein
LRFLAEKAAKQPETNIHGLVPLMGKNPPGAGGCAIRGGIMFSVARPHNLSVVMVGRIFWYGSFGSDAGNVLANELHATAAFSSVLTEWYQAGFSYVDGPGLKISKIEKFAIMDAQRPRESFVTA